MRTFQTRDRPRRRVSLLMFSVEPVENRSFSPSVFGAGQAARRGAAVAGIHSGRYDGRMQSIEIDPELNRHALAEAAQQYPEFAGHALRVIARPLSRGFAWQLEWQGAPPPEEASYGSRHFRAQSHAGVKSIFGSPDPWRVDGWISG